MMFWIDVETTGLDATADDLLEIACVATDNELLTLARGPSLVIKHSPDFVAWKRLSSDPVVVDMHTKNRLWEEVLGDDAVPLRTVELLCIEFFYASARELDVTAPRGRIPLAGSTVSFDRAFLKRHMPLFESCFHYRNIDVSTIKELARRWRPQVSDQYDAIAKDIPKQHRAMPDVMASIRELDLYKHEWLMPVK